MLINTHSLTCEAKYLFSARAHILYVFLPFWMVNTISSYPLFKDNGYLLGEELEITERDRGTENLRKCFRALYSKAKTEKCLQKLEIGNFLVSPLQSLE